jgi:hypothetical protein
LGEKQKKFVPKNWTPPNGSLPFPLWAKQVQKENTELLHEVLKEMNSHCLGRVLVNIPQNCGTL